MANTLTRTPTHRCHWTLFLLLHRHWHDLDVGLFGLHALVHGHLLLLGLIVHGGDGGCCRRGSSRRTATIRDGARWPESPGHLSTRFERLSTNFWREQLLIRFVRKVGQTYSVDSIIQFSEKFTSFRNFSPSREESGKERKNIQTCAKPIGLDIKIKEGKLQMIFLVYARWWFFIWLYEAILWLSDIKNSRIL